MKPVDFTDLEHYGLIGNLETCALVNRNGGVDWLCLPYLESPSVFAALLDTGRGGSLSISPVLKFDSLQTYEPDANVIHTVFSTPTGECRMTDFMPFPAAGTDHRMLVRRVEGLRQECRLDVVFDPRFDYGRGHSCIETAGKKVIATAKDQPELVLCTSLPLAAGTGGATGVLYLKEGDVAWFFLRWGDDRHLPLDRDAGETLLHATVNAWHAWCRTSGCSPSITNQLSQEMAVRSGLTLKLLAEPKSGAIAAAATTSLPESVGGLRNWDYRYAWLRDASFTAQALHHLGHDNEAVSYRRWVLKLVGKLKDLSRIKPLYGIHLNIGSQETFIDNLCGYRYSAPVRVGNLAAGQTQIDIYGEIVNAVYDITRYGHDITGDVWEVVRRIVDYVCRIWMIRDRGIWEMRTPPRHFVHSKLMCWVALDRGLRIAADHGFTCDEARWRRSRDDIRQAILEKGFSSRLNSFVQAFDSEELDASSVLVAAHGFLPPQDPRVQGTLDAVMKHLYAGRGLVYRYHNEDGLAGREGAFLLCSFWLIDALSLSGRIEEADELFSEVLRHVGPAGLLAEMVDPDAGRMIGNFPQAISHIGLINTALHLGIAKGGEHREPRPLAHENADRHQEKEK